MPEEAIPRSRRLHAKRLISSPNIFSVTQPALSQPNGISVVGFSRPYATAPAASAAPNATTFPCPCASEVASACSARLITSVTMSTGS